MNPFKLAALSAALCFASSTAVVANDLAKAENKAAKEAISATYKVDKVACKPLAGNLHDICIEEAKGRERIAKADLAVRHEPSDKHRYELGLAKAESIYAVAKEKCDELSGDSKSLCRKEAKGAYVNAKANAKLAEKTADANATAREKTTEARQDAATDKRDADYAIAKEKCEVLANDAKTHCIKEAKSMYGKS